MPAKPPCREIPVEGILSGIPFSSSHPPLGGTLSNKLACMANEAMVPIPRLRPLTCPPRGAFAVSRVPGNGRPGRLGFCRGHGGGRASIGRQPSPHGVPDALPWSRSIHSGRPFWKRVAPTWRCGVRVWWGIMLDSRACMSCRAAPPKPCGAYRCGAPSALRAYRRRRRAGC